MGMFKYLVQMSYFTFSTTLVTILDTRSHDIFSDSVQYSETALLSKVGLISFLSFSDLVLDIIIKV